ncbi:MlaD family protein [Actinocorallia longicatena]|uniref:Phospholipid/cholesterol/gamma-HCH transport system substrate-binding protein n=1 Tax=Actinocorallia longicatena TaxID=111803 RepID=A0ABP6PZ27_9ACTN
MKKLLAVGLIAVSTSACSVQTLGAPKGGFEFTAEFDDVQNLVVGHSVQVSDVRIGTVISIKVDPQFHAHVTMQLSPGRKLPQGVTATIAKTSLLGENYVKIGLPAGANMESGPFMPEHFDIKDTGVQPDLESITEKVGPILAAIGGDDLHTIVDSLATALKDKGPDLNALIRKLRETTDSYAKADDDIDAVIVGLARLGSSLAKSGDQLDRLPGRLELATQRIQADKKELKAAVQSLVHLGESFNSKVHDEHATRMQNLLHKLDRVLKSMVRGRQELKTLTKDLYTGMLAAPSMTYQGEGLMQAWLAGFLPFETNAKHITANGGRGETIPALNDSVRRSLGLQNQED